LAKKIKKKKKKLHTPRRKFWKRKGTLQPEKDQSQNSKKRDTLDFIPNPHSKLPRNRKNNF
jgi:hypothetical protein